jgi:hypothetical protein
MVCWIVLKIILVRILTKFINLAVNLINQFLQVKIDRRMSANKALQHPWFSEDLNLYGDLTNLEKRLNHKWLISKDQEEKWIKLINESESIHL